MYVIKFQNCVFCEFDYICLEDLYHIFGVLWASWICMFISLSRFGKISLNKFSSPFSTLSGIPQMHTLVHLTVSHNSHRLFSFFFVPLCNFKWSVFMFTDFFFNMLLKLSVEFSSLVLVFYSSRILFLLIISVSLLDFLFCSCIVFLISFSSLYSLVAHWASLIRLFWILCQSINLHFFRVGYWCFVLFLWWCYVSLIVHNSGGQALVSVCLNK